ncbi:MAG: hypothetical protein KGL39_50585 [Patescibacteria group bacterium]|nr:hypothetical protein [Patescibacteria group bacterium]
MNNAQTINLVVGFVVASTSALASALGINATDWHGFVASVVLGIVAIGTWIWGHVQHGKTVAVALLVGLLMLGTAQAQTSAPSSGSVSNALPPITIGTGPAGLSVQGLFDTFIASTNAAFTAGGGRGLTGNKNLFFADYLYKFNANAGLLLGYDHLWGSGQSQDNVVKGGLNLQATLIPFKSFGLTNFVVQPFAAYLVATPTGGPNSGGIGAIAVGGVDYKYALTTAMSLDMGVLFENRTGQGYWDGNYVALEGAFRWGF